jgi:hypothetical protein
VLKPSKCFIISILVFSFFCLMSRIDFIVHGVLYSYNLRFSYEWANEYWIIYGSLFVLFSVVMALMYWWSSNKTSRDAKISMGLFATINLLVIGGLEDLMLYVFWANGLPPNNVVWWWIPLCGLLGTWNSSMQVAFFALSCSILVSLWFYVLRK